MRKLCIEDVYNDRLCVKFFNDLLRSLVPPSMKIMATPMKKWLPRFRYCAQISQRGISAVVVDAIIASQWCYVVFNGFALFRVHVSYKMTFRLGRLQVFWPFRDFARRVLFASCPSKETQWPDVSSVTCFDFQIISFLWRLRIRREAREGTGDFKDEIVWKTTQVPIRHVFLLKVDTIT